LVNNQTWFMARIQAEKQIGFSFLHSSEAKQFVNINAEERGAVFTRREVVEFILDLSGYTADRPLHQDRLLEPSFGAGDFLLPAVERLLKAYKTRFPDCSGLERDLSGAIRAVEVHEESINETRKKLLNLFQAEGISEKDARSLIESWIIEGDFLLIELPWEPTHAVGNPPYVRQELIPGILLAEYKRRYQTIYDRADLYIPFIERSLRALKPGGTLGFICADRWMKNKYGAPLRALVSDQFRLVYYVDMVETQAFLSDVSAYPAITIIRREKEAPTRIAHRPPIDANILSQLAKAMCAEVVSKESGVVEISGIVKDNEPWILHSFDQLAVVRHLEAEFPLLEDAGCKVGIGVATGADRVYTGRYEELDVEPDRKLPLVKTKDIESGTVKWMGYGVIDPFADNGSLVDLSKYPRLARYLEKHEVAIRRRRCARENTKGWYRTIDRIYPELTYKPKLLIPDIKGEAHIVYEDGQYYPHHNLYFITSDEWDLKALQAVLRSGIAKLFVSIYSTQMRGGYLRFQAQYLRRIRLPRWEDVPCEIQAALKSAANTGDLEACNRAAFDLYRLTPMEWAAIEGNGKSRKNGN
jgi:hypothetical protein